MLEATPAFVPGIVTHPRRTMGEAPTKHQEGPVSTSALPGTGMSDERLMIAFSKGSTEAFSELFRRYKQPVYGFFRRRIVESALAEELSQETFIVLLRSAARYEQRALFRTYLYAIAFKTLSSYRRKAAFRAMFFGQRKLAEEASRPDVTEKSLWVRRAVERLEPVDREIVMLREFEELSYAEISELLRLPLNTVRTRLFRARVALRKLLEPSAEKGERQ
jgi:RNA polymerase sigma-70 factor, ECF subfamily